MLANPLNDEQAQRYNFIDVVFSLFLVGRFADGLVGHELFVKPQLVFEHVADCHNRLPFDLQWQPIAKNGDSTNDTLAWSCRLLRQATTRSVLPTESPAERCD